MSAWYDGLTFEQVLSRVRESKEPLTVPQGFGAWFDASRPGTVPPTTTEGSVPDPIDKLVDEIWESRNEPTRNEIEAELWRRLFGQLDRIEAGQGPRTLRQGQDHLSAVQGRRNAHEYYAGIEPNGPTIKLDPPLRDRYRDSASVGASVPSEASSHGTVTIRSYNPDNYPAGHGFGTENMIDLYPDANSTEPARTWQSALRQLADTLAPGYQIQLDQHDPEVACAAIVETVQSYHEIQVQCALFDQLILRMKQVMSAGPAPYSPEDFLGSMLDQLRVNLFPNGRPASIDPNPEGDPK